MQGDSSGEEVVKVNEDKLRKMIARRMRVAMARVLINQANLAKATGLTPGGVSQILNEKRTADLKSITAIASTLGVSAGWLMGEEKKA